MQVELQRKDLSEEELFTARRASAELAEMDDSVETRLGLRLELIRESPSASSLQQRSDISDIRFNAEQRHPTAANESQQTAAHQRLRPSRDDCLGGSAGTKRQEVESGELVQAEWRVSTDLQEHAQVTEEEMAFKNELEHSEESEGEELNGNKQASYIHHQPQPAFALQQDSLYMCIPCGEGFPSSEQLIAHVESHSAEQLGEDAQQGAVIKVDVEDPERISCHVCSVCSQSYMDAALLRKHERSHWLIRPFSCSICGKLFTQRGTMTRHMRSHLGLKPFACEECGMRFTRQYRKMEHMRIHTREKPYVCPLCGVRFTLQRSVISHLKMHSVS